jgi:hypothetical protein
MTPEDTSAAAAGAIHDLPSKFMLDPATYQRGAELGFDGIDIYVAGRGGALGEVHGEVVASAFVFFTPTTVVEAWDRAAGVMSRHEAATHFIGVGHDWADANLPDDLEAARLAELLGVVTAAASPAAAPLFAAWRARPEPGPDRPRALVLHRLNLLRELRGALHGAAVLAQGLSPHEAVSQRTPYMLGIYGYDGPHAAADEPERRALSSQVDAATDRAMGAAFAALDDASRAELVELLAAASA